jgi:hypothetical protein
MFVYIGFECLTELMTNYRRTCIPNTAAVYYDLDSGEVEFIFST